MTWSINKEGSHLDKDERPNERQIKNGRQNISEDIVKDINSIKNIYKFQIVHLSATVN